MDTLIERTELFQRKKLSFLKEQQKKDGSWRFCFEGPVMTNCFFILLLTSLEIEDKELIADLARGIRAKQKKDGTFINFSDESSGNLTATVQGYVGMLASGIYKKSDPHMVKAEQFITSRGLSDVHFMTKWMLAANGWYPWPFLYLPMSFLHIPASFPVHFYHLSTYARIHFVPMAITLNRRFFIKNKAIPTLKHLDENMTGNPFGWFEAKDTRGFPELKEIWKYAWALPAYFHNLGNRTGLKFMLDRIEKDGTLYSYASATIFMIYSLLSLGYKKESSVIQKAIGGVASLMTKTDHYVHLENSTSTVWDTALISYAIQEAEKPGMDECINASAGYLLRRQHHKTADWIVRNPKGRPGGWGFSDINTNNPDNDDTAAVLKAIPSFMNESAWNRGLQWLLSMQNNDGGYGAFEKNMDHPLLRALPLESAEEAAIDPSTADVTGRVLHFLGSKTVLSKTDGVIKRAVDWLLDHQEANGSWYGRWGVCYIYGTWAALTGLRAAGVKSSHPAVRKAIHWLKKIQLDDGSFGESCKSCEIKSFVPLPFGTIVQTSWAVEALLQYEWASDPAIEKGIHFIISENQSVKQLKYPTGIGLPKQFYIYYHSYPHVFSLLACNQFLKKTREMSVKS